MQTGKYIKENGEEVEVVNFDEINKMVEVKFERGKPQYYHEHDYSTWKKEGEREAPFNQEPDAGGTIEVVNEREFEWVEKNEEKAEQPIVEEKVEEIIVPEEPAVQETTSGIEHNPITDEPKRRKRTPIKKEVKTTPKKKGK